MAVNFTQAELDQIKQWHDQGLSDGNRSAMYLGIAGLLQAKLQGASDSDRAMLNQDILWLQGASQANTGSGVYATLIRAYTQAQAQLRMGAPVSDALMQSASNAVGDALFATIQSLGGQVPNIGTIAEDDATAVGNTIFKPTIPNDSASLSNAGWSGTLLFSMLGSDQTSRLLANQSGVTKLDDLRNVLFGLYSMGQALQAALATGKDEAIQYFKSLLQGSSAGPLLTDLSITFNTLTSTSNFIEPAVAFFQHTGLYSTVSDFAHIGLNNMLDFMRSAYAGVPTTGTTDSNFAANAYTFFGSISGSLNTWGGGLVDVDALLADALNASSSNDGYRNALSALTPVVITGMPLTDRNVSLWHPGATTGLTANYLIARADMLRLGLLYDRTSQAQGALIQGDDLANQVYYDLSLSAQPIYRTSGHQQTVTDITMFGGGTAATLLGDSGNDRLFGGAGSDTLEGGAGNNTLEGGAGVDTYIIAGESSGTDRIIDTDGQGAIEWQTGDGAQALTGGDDLPGTSVWKSIDGAITYDEDIAADGSTELEVISKNRTLIIDDFTNGDFGIHLNAAPTEPTGSSNLATLAQTTYADHFEYRDLNNTSGSARDSIYGASTTDGLYNIIEGEGNAGYIFVGDGNNLAFANDFRYTAATQVFDTPVNVTIQGGSGNQLMVGLGNGNEIIIGGNLGQDSTAWDTIDGGGANGQLISGSQNGVIYGGTGADTLVAGSMSNGAGQGPSNVIIAGLSFWGSSLDPQNGSIRVTGEPLLDIPALTDPGAFQINLSLSQLDGSYAAPIGLLGSSMDFGGPDSSPALPGSVLVGGTGLDYLIGNRGNDSISGGTPANPVAGGVDEVLVGGSGADLIRGGSGTELIYGDLSPGAATNWADLDPSNADTIYGGAGKAYIYGSGGNDAIYGSTGDYTIYTGNGNNYVQTGSGTALVYGGSGNDSIVSDAAASEIWMGSGNGYAQADGGASTIHGGAGSDTVALDAGNNLIAEGAGHTTVVTRLNAGSDTIQSGAGGTSIELVGGLTSADIIVRDVGGNLVLYAADGDAQLMVANYFAGGTGVSLQFDNGTTWSDAQILQASMAPVTDGSDDTLIGSDGNDSITAGYGNTLIVGTSGNNVLIGGAGNDTIQGGSGADTISGGSGVTQVRGGSGLETYVFDIGDGSETISANTAGAGVDTLQFGVGIDPSVVTYAHGASADDLLISFGATTGATVTIANFFSATANQHQVGAFKFSDGTTLTHDQVIQQVETINGTTGDDNLRGTGGVNYFDGKGGNDVEVGNSASDTFVFNPGYGHLEVYEDFDPTTATPIVKLGAGITASTLNAMSPNGSDLYLTDGVSGDQVFLLSGVYAPWGIKEVQFADGTSLTKGQLIQIAVDEASTTGNDMIYGSIDASVYDGKGGDDTVFGGGGNDTFIFNEGYGHLTVRDNAVVIDANYVGPQQAVLKLGPGITTSTLRVTAGTTELFLADGVNGDKVTLEDMFNKASANVGVQLVQLSDGTAFTQAQLIQMELAGGTTGSETLHGGLGDELIDGKGGNDLEIGGGGNDTFVFNAGYGQLVINNSYQAGQAPVLQLGAGIAASAMHVMSDDTSLYLTDGVSGDLITLQGALITSNAGVSMAQLSDGTQLTFAQLTQMVGVPTGTAGDDILYGRNRAEYFDGKGGNDFESGGGGADTFVFNANYGHLEISETQYSGGPVPALQLGTGITASTLKVVIGADGTDLLLTDGISGDQVTLDKMASDSADYGVQTVQFADGSTLTAAQLITLAHQFTGTTGNDTLSGTSGADVFDGKGGSDLAIGNGGNDTFVFNTGYGHLEINEIYAHGASPLLQLGAGITSSTLKVKATADGSGLVLTDGTAGDQITLDGALANSGTNGVAKVKFSDGTTLTATQLVQKEITGGSTGSDTLYGTSGAEKIDGKGGNDVVVGNGGNDTFVFNKNYGHLEINEVYSSSQAPVLQLGTGITSTTLKVVASADGTALVLTDGISGDQVTLDNALANTGSKGVATVKFADGTVLTAAQLVQKANGGAAPAAQQFTQRTADQPSSYAGIDSLAPTASSLAASIQPGRSHLVPGAGDITMNGISTPPTLGGKHVATRLVQSAIGRGIPARAADTSADSSTTSLPSVSLRPAAVITSHSPADGSQSRWNRTTGPGEETRVSAGAPADHVANDLNDAGAWMSADTSTIDATEGSAQSRRATASPMEPGGARPQARVAMLGRTADAANDMIKALSAQGSLQQSLGQELRGQSSQIQLQDGTLWSLSALDKTMSAVAPAATIQGSGAGRMDPSFGSADLAHAQLISAMAAFGPVAPADTSLPSSASEAYAITLAAQAH